MRCGGVTVCELPIASGGVRPGAGSVRKPRPRLTRRTLPRSADFGRATYLSVASEGILTSGNQKRSASRYGGCAAPEEHHGLRIFPTVFKLAFLRKAFSSTTWSFIGGTSVAYLSHAKRPKISEVSRLRLWSEKHCASNTTQRYNADSENTELEHGPDPQGHLFRAWHA